MNHMPEQKQNPLSLKKSAIPLRALSNRTQTSSGNEIWLLTLSDLLMLLMIFFVFLLAAPLAQNAKSISDEAQPPAAVKTAIAAAPVTLPVDETPITVENPKTDALEEELLFTLTGGDNPQGVTVERRAHRIVLTFPEQILFDSGQANLKTAADETLEKVAAFLIDHPDLSVEVQGHTDDQPIRSARYPSNWELSADRATQVAKALMELGANPQQIAIKGFGEFHPVVPNLSDADRLKNRRVEVQFYLTAS